MNGDSVVQLSQDSVRREANRLSDSPHQVTFRATPGEIAAYKIGMPVIVQVRPA